MGRRPRRRDPRRARRRSCRSPSRRSRRSRRASPTPQAEVVRPHHLRSSVARRRSRRSSASRAPLAALLVSLAFTPGCGPPRPKPVDLSMVQREYTTADYGLVLSRWTRAARLQKDFDRVAPFDTALDARATFLAWDWRNAYVERYADLYKLPAGEKDKLRQEQLKEATDFHEFHISASASRHEWTNFLNVQ